jgi:exonuclease SbcC
MPELRMMIKEKSKIFSKIKDESPEQLKVDIKEKQLELEEIQKNIQASLTRIEDIQASIENLKQTGDKCPICDNKLPKAKKSKILAEKRKNIAKFKRDSEKFDKIEKLEEKLNLVESFKDKLELVESDKKEFARLEVELKDLKDESKLLDNNKRMSEKNIELISRNLEDLQNKQMKLKEILFKREEVDSKLEKIREYKNELTKVSLERDKYSMFSQTTLDIVETDYRNVLVLERGLETNLEHTANTVSEKLRLLEEIENKRQSLEAIRQEIKKVEALGDQFRLLEMALLDTQDKLRKDFVLAVNQAMQSIWSDLYPYKDIYSVKLAIEEGDYVLQLQDSTGWIPADGIASGGERSMACLALRIAFAMVLAPQLKWLVLDEPTHNLDSKAVEVLAETLRERASNLVDQIFLITHDQNLESAVSGYLYRLEREKEKDGFTKVIPISGPQI